jgi:hypothetical protein
MIRQDFFVLQWVEGETMAITSTSVQIHVTVSKILPEEMTENDMRAEVKEIAARAKVNTTYAFSTAIFRQKWKIYEMQNGSVKHVAVIDVYREPGKMSAGVIRENFEKVKDLMRKKAEKLGWELSEQTSVVEEVAVPVVVEPKPKKAIRSRTDVVLPPLDADAYAKHFHRLYNREPQIRIIYDSAHLAVRTDFKERAHVLLRGPAGTAKTDLFTSFVSFVGADKVWHVDATTLTKAGLERELLSRSREGTLAPFLLIEEIEKVTSPENINCLLQVMDTRGRIQRTNARDGDVYEECKIVVWATCNDSDYLRTFADGEIWSRFSLRPICKRPDADLMRRILLRSVVEMGGDQKWVEPVIRFMWDDLKLIKEYKNDYNDPRLGRALLAGGDRLFDTSKEGFFADFIACCEGKETGEEEKK